MKKLIVLLMVMVMATSAFAVVDQDDNSMGFYFDTEADLPCIDGVAPYAQSTMYLVLTNPTFDTLLGFEAGYSFEGPATIISAAFMNPEAINFGQPNNMIVGFGGPTTTSPVTTLVTYSVMYMSTTGEPVTFSLFGSEPSSIDPAYPVVLMADSELMQTGLSTIDGVTAQINAGCTVVATEALSFDSIKSLYR